jgi:uncharacterized damage-inducible protein DinB
MLRTAIATLLLAATPAIIAQSKASAPVANPVISAMRQQEERQSKNLTAAVEEMPADKYGYRPTPPQMTFGHLVMHIAEGNNFLCALIAGEPQHEVKLSETDSKETLTKAVQDSFAYCEQVLAKADDSTLGQSVALAGGQTSTRAATLIRLVSGWADHYGAASMYLRLNNLLPPSAQKPAGK